MALATVYGANITRLVYTWWGTIQWNHPQEEEPLSKWGISWLELYCNFVIVTGQHMPINVAQKAFDHEWIPWDTDRAQLLPLKKKHAGAQQRTLQWLMKAIARYLGRDLWPTEVPQKAQTLTRLGFNADCWGGIAKRPRILQPQETIDMVWALLQGQGSGGRMTVQLPPNKNKPSISVEKGIEPTQKQRKEAQKRLRDKQRVTREQADEQFESFCNPTACPHTCLGG